MIRVIIASFSSQDTYFRFTKVRYAGRFGYALKGLTG